MEYTMEIPPGTWRDSSLVDEITPTQLVVQCRDMSGRAVRNTLVPAPGNSISYTNVNGVMWPDTLPRSVTEQEWQIPPTIFQTHKSQQYVRDHPELRAAQQSWQRWPGFAYEFFDDKDCDVFMEEHFPALHPLYAALPLPVMKADIWRYAVLYVRGGIYVDMDLECKSSPHVLQAAALLCGVAENKTHMCQFVMAAPARSPLLGAVLDMIEKRLRALGGPVRPHHFRENTHLIHNLTGPGVFTDGVEEGLRSLHLPIFTQDRRLYHHFPRRVMHIHPPRFHENDIKHLFSGQWADGWVLQKSQYEKSA